ncbi:MAG: DUF169 domain-containing protein [Dehalococcoidales bacterium]|nr:DUF169 domain-containing protein [Dehalococcoidales bacterium]
MPTLDDFHAYGEELEKQLILKTSPVAVKMLKNKDEIPAGAYRPKRDHNVHLAQCQAFAMSRREKATVAMCKEDHWCPAALLAYGLVERPAVIAGHPYDTFEYGKYIGILTAPLTTTSFVPDSVIIYSDTAQLRSLLMTFPVEEVQQVNSHFFPPSCAYSVVHVMLTGQYWAVLPDPGEKQRALSGDDEMMFGVPADKMEKVVSRLKKFEGTPLSYRNHNTLMLPDFPHPGFYKDMFRGWGLEVKD